MTAFGRAAGIPTRLHFVDLKNHLLRPEWIEKLDEKIIYYGFVEFYLNGKWVKASPAYDKELCIRHNYYITEFNGRDDALFKSSDLSGNRFMDYIKDHGTFAKVPYIRIVSTWFKYYAPYILKYKRKNRKTHKIQNSKKN